MDTEQIELELLISAVRLKYGYDFSQYAKPSFLRRVLGFVYKSHSDHISDLIPRLLYDEMFFNEFVFSISVTVTEMFRDPEVYIDIRKSIIPYLRSFSRINVWHAGCATGEEVYSFAILLKEEGLYDRAQIYATDINSNSIQIAKDAIYSVDCIKQGTENYRKSGGKFSFTDYYTANYGKVILDQSLKKNIFFSTHNLISDGAFNQMHLVMCRNVLIYFNRELQNKVLEKLAGSIVHNGFMCLGTQESIKHQSTKSDFETISSSNKLYRKILD